MKHPQRKADKFVLSFARWIIKGEIKKAGIKISTVHVSEITKAARKLIYDWQNE
jgi:hypothetical protein